MENALVPLLTALGDSFVCYVYGIPAPLQPLLFSFLPLISQLGITKAFVHYIDNRTGQGAYVDPQICLKKRRKLACILPSITPPFFCSVLF